MVQGCDISIMDVKSSVSKSVKVAAPTEEQKRLAQLSHIERIDTLENDIIKRMVEITKHSYEECAMELAGTNMDMESAINNLIEGNSEEWETMSKKVRPEKKPAVPVSEPADATKTKRSSSKSERGRSTKSEETRDTTADRSRSSATRGGSNARGASSASRGGSAVRGTSGRGGAATSRGRGGKRQLPPRMDSNRQREDSSKPRFESEARRSDTSTRTGGRGGGGRSNGSYRHNYRGAKRPSEHESHEWGSANGGADTEESTNYSAEWTEDLGGAGWSRESGDKTTGWNSENTSGWGASEDTSTTSWVGGESDAPSSSATASSQPPSSDNAWPTEQEEQTTDTISEVSQWQNSADDTPAPVPPTNTGHFDTAAATSKPASQFDVGAHKRPAYTQAFSNSLSSILTSTEFAQPTSSSSFGFGFSQTPSSVSSDYNSSRHEQAPGSTSLLKIQEALNSNSSNNAVTSARKISVEQLFQMHEKSTPDNATPTSIPEENGPSSPPTSSTSSNQSGRRSKRAQRTIPTEPVEMPGSAIESLDVQFGSIGFMDTSEEDASLPGEKTPANKMDAATSTTPHSAVETDQAGLVPGIQPISESDRLLHTSVPTTVPQHSPQQSAFQSPHPAIHPVPHSLQSHSLHQTSTASLHHAHQGVSSLQASGAVSHHSSHGMASGHQTGAHQSPSGTAHVSGATPLSAQHTMQSAASHQPAAHSTVTTQSGVSSSLHSMSQNSLGQQSLAQQPAPPPNLPPPNMDNIRNANNLITNRSMPEEVSQFGIKKSLPPGVYPTANLRSSANSFYYGEGSSVSSIPPQQHNQSSGYDARYYSTNNSNSYDGHHSHRQLQQLAESTFSSQGVVQDKQQHVYPSTGHRSSSDVQQQQQQLSTASHQPPHVGAGITSGISTTAAAPTGLGGGYPGPVLGYHYPIHPYPNNLYAAAAANYYHPFNHAALSYPQTQKPSVASYPATNTFGSSGDSSSAAGSQFGGYETPEYKEMQYAAGTNKQGTGGGGGGGMSHLPVTTSNEYSKMMGADKNMFNMQYMQFPNYIQQIQQGQGQAAALIQQQGGLQQQRGVEQQRNPGAPIPHSHKHYWSHR